LTVVGSLRADSDSDIEPDMSSQAKDPRGGRFSQAVLDALPAQVAVLDPQGRIVAVNQAWRRFAAENGGPPELQAGLGLDYLAACRDATGEDAEEAQAVAEGVAAVLGRRAEAFSLEYPCHAPDRERWFSVNVTPLGEAMEGAVVVHFDVSARKQAENQARQARECAAQAARVSAVGVLAASLVHELTQPLSAAGFYSGTAVALLGQGRGRGQISPDRDKDRLQAALDGVDAQIQRATDIVQRLRGFLRQREMRLEPVPIEEVVAGATGLVQWFAADRKVRLRFARPERCPVVVGDAIQLEQVLVNLVCNSIQAIDAADMPHREVSIGLEQRPSEVEVTVRDTGPGVAPGDHERLFDIFASTKDVGLGLGLSISREIVEAHGGRLWSDSSADAGAVFHFTLPLPGEGAGSDA
jgi:C4-dicarboxylate-specific signal transduction histidine kinase